MIPSIKILSFIVANHEWVANPKSWGLQDCPDGLYKTLGLRDGVHQWAVPLDLEEGLYLLPIESAHQGQIPPQAG